MHRFSAVGAGGTSEGISVAPVLVGEEDRPLPLSVPSVQLVGIFD